MRPLTPDTEEQSDRRRGWSVIKRTLPYLWPEGQPMVKVRVVAAFLALFAAQLLSVLAPQFLAQAVDALTPETPDAATYLGLGAIGLSIAYGLSQLMSVGFRQLRDVFFTRVGQGALRQLALTTFSHIHRLSMRYHLSRQTGGLSRIIERGVKGVEYLLRFILFSIGPLVLQFVLICIALAWSLDPIFLLVILVVVILYVWFTFTVTEWRVKLRKVMNTQDTDANQKAIDSLLNFETVKYFNAERWEIERYDSAMRNYVEAAVKTNYSLAFLNFGQSLIISSGVIIVLVLAVRGVVAGELTVGDFVLVNAYMLQITQPLNFLGSVYRDIRQALVDMGDLFDLLDQPPEVEEKKNATDLTVTDGAISFKGVQFGYDADRQILKGVDIDVVPGRTVALVGSTGSGKSTIGRLLFRFYDVTDGSVTIDGQDIRDVTMESLHSQIGVVPQDTVLFNDTIFYNISYGRPDASRDEVIAAAKAAKIHDFVENLPKGYDTQVGERGLKLSGGEKQRVGIARTILKNPPILLLDEATSALDTETEQEIQAELSTMSAGRTVITIAHRLSTIADADEIVVLEAGEVIERGTHAELLSRDGRYAHLWNRQLDEAAA
ncbi:ABCB family ABC transporter ATP-binding protein/permease [Cognatiyoonia sp.]|uniref:ABCB family ABC transporter ATP-binding protein/permease n=1 Tax=Cognatiyoonia sp. TaxID=2211652 RepID=UPI003F69BCBA